jgi:hypothetical protein
MNQLWVYQLLIYQHNIYIAQPNNYHQYVQPRDRFRDQTHQAELFRETHPKAIHVLIHHSTPDRFEITLHQAFKFVTLVFLIAGILSVFFKYLLKAHKDHSIHCRKIGIYLM